ncbi:hypothetical protein [Amycolatopsis sp. NPDC003861]
MNELDAAFGVSRSLLEARRPDPRIRAAMAHFVARRRAVAPKSRRLVVALPPSATVWARETFRGGRRLRS